MKVSERIVSPFTIKVVSDIITNTNGNIQPPTKISSSNAEDFIAPEVRQILGKFDLTQLQRIYKTAAYLSMDNLKKNVAAMVAVRVYVADKKDFEEKQLELKVSKPFSFTLIEEMKKEMPELDTILQ